MTIATGDSLLGGSSSDEALGDVGERGVALAHAVEELTGPGKITAALAQIGERVPDPQVMLGRPLHPLPRRSSIATASRNRPRSASEPAITMRPSDTSAADGDAAASSSQSDSTARNAAATARSP